MIYAKAHVKILLSHRVYSIDVACFLILTPSTQPLSTCSDVQQQKNNNLFWASSWFKLRGDKKHHRGFFFARLVAIREKLKENQKIIPAKFLNFTPLSFFFFLFRPNHAALMRLPQQVCENRCNFVSILRNDKKK